MFYGKKLCGIITRPASCPASWALLLLAAVTALGLLSQGAAWAKGTQELIVEQAARLNIELNEQEAAVLRRTLPIIGRRYLREMDSTPLLKATMEGLKEYDAALAGIKKTAKDEDAEAPEVTPSEYRRIALALNKGLNTLDAHSAYMDPNSYKELKIRISGKFAGLGLEVTMDDGLVKVIAPIDDTPAQRAGMQTGDKISHVDGTPIKGMTLREAVSRMRGLVGTTIRLTVLREEVTDPFEVLIVRDVIRVPAVRHRVEADYGYIRISGFSQRTEQGLRTAMTKIDDALGGNSLGLIVDLRNNPGGLLRQAIRVSDVFLDEGTIVSVRGRLEEDNDLFRASDGDLATGKTVIILVNEGTASAAEIVAGALQENHRAIVVGYRSFGKGSVQTIFSMGDSGALRLTTALYYTPSGRTIQAWGILPDLLIESDGKKSGRREEELKGALSRGEATPHVIGPRATIRGERCNQLLAKPMDDHDLACAVALLRAGSLDRLEHLASSVAGSQQDASRKE
ncbi:MAG: S41 family peptidase [Rhodospirillaceae bacterium]|jgi:carboxyl-terminal processing protease|nr:S41 family peptidase [Rhodospirillaceae bacterium]MBT5081921.1 S41 family peptidase [Rhodospirillaceae bacterium]